MSDFTYYLNLSIDKETYVFENLKDVRDMLYLVKNWDTPDEEFVVDFSFTTAGASANGKLFKGLLMDLPESGKDVKIPLEALRGFESKGFALWLASRRMVGKA